MHCPTPSPEPERYIRLDDGRVIIKGTEDKYLELLIASLEDAVQAISYSTKSVGLLTRATFKIGIPSTQDGRLLDEFPGRIDNLVGTVDMACGGKRSLRSYKMGNEFLERRRLRDMDTWGRRCV